MQTSSLPVDNLQRLLNGVSEHGSRHLREVEADLTQTNFLLAEAIDKLAASFVQIYTVISAQQQLLDALMQRHGMAADEAQNFQALREQLAQEINTVITGLQFQDLTNQLITSTLKRVTGLRELLAALSNYDGGMPSAHEHAAIANLLEQIRNSLSTNSGALQAGLRQQVKQKHMDSGEIELF